MFAWQRRERRRRELNNEVSQKLATADLTPPLVKFVQKERKARVDAMSDYVALLVRGANRLSEASIEKEKIELAEQRGRRGSSFGLSGTTDLSSRSSSSSSSKQDRTKTATGLIREV